MVEKTTNQQAVCNLFNLPSNEKTYDDFGCSLHHKIFYNGRMFITENYICFNSSFLGMQEKIKLKIREILQVNKVKHLMKNYIEIISNERHFDSRVDDKLPKQEKMEKPGKYYFTSFSSFETAYSRIKKIKKHIDIKLGRINSKGISSDEESEDENHRRKSNGESRKSSAINKSTSPTQSETDENLRMTINPNLNKENYFTDADTSFNGLSKIEKTQVKKSINSFCDEKTNLRLSKIESDENKDKEDKFEKKEYIHINDLENFFSSLDSKICEIPKFVLDISLNGFFDRFLSDSADCSWENYSSTLQDRSIIKSNKWVEVEQEEVSSNENLKKLATQFKEKPKDEEKKTLQNLMPNKAFVREFSFRMKMRNVPFVDYSDIIKHQKVMKINNKTNGIIFYSSTTSIGVPYADYFTVDETWEIFPVYEKATKTEKIVMRITFFNNFTKSTLLRKTIESRSIESFIEDISNWKDFCLKKQITNMTFSSFKSKNQDRGSLTHGLVKEDYDPYDEDLAEKLAENKTIRQKVVQFVIRTKKNSSLLFKELKRLIAFSLEYIKTNFTAKDLIIAVLLIVVVYNSYLVNQKLEKIGIDN